MAMAWRPTCGLAHVPPTVVLLLLLPMTVLLPVPLPAPVMRTRARYCGRSKAFRHVACNADLCRALAKGAVPRRAVPRTGQLRRAVPCCVTRIDGDAHLFFGSGPFDFDSVWWDHDVIMTFTRMLTPRTDVAVSN